MNDDLDLVHGSGNVFCDFDTPDADLEQARTLLAAKIIAVLDETRLTAQAAAERTGIAASEFSRIRNVKLDRFTIDRMISILGKLGQEVEVSISVRPRAA